MNKKIIYVLVGAASIFFIISLVVFLQSNKEPQQNEFAEMEKTVEEAIKKAEFIDLKAFFLSERSRYMRPVLYEVESRGIREELYWKLVDILFTGAEDYISPIPIGVTLRSLYYVKEEGLLILDFNEELMHRFPSGTEAEIEFIYFLVDNFCYNFKEIKKVKFLSGGNDIKTLTGHLDMESPFFPDWGYLVDQ